LKRVLNEPQAIPDEVSSDFLYFYRQKLCILSEANVVLKLRRSFSEFMVYRVSDYISSSSCLDGLGVIRAVLSLCVTCFVSQAFAWANALELAVVIFGKSLTSAFAVRAVTAPFASSDTPFVSSDTPLGCLVFEYPF